MFYWNPDHPETQFLFNDRDPKTGKIFTVLFDLSADGGKGKRIREYRFRWRRSESYHWVRPDGPRRKARAVAGWF